jgi:mycoredoxin
MPPHPSHVIRPWLRRLSAAEVAGNLRSRRSFAATPPLSREFASGAVVGHTPAGIAGCGVRLLAVTYDFSGRPARYAGPNHQLEENFVDFTPESGTITMFSTTWCGYCNRLKKQLDAQGIGYTEINIEEVEGTADLVEQLNGGNRTVPTVLFPDGTAATNPSAAEVKSRLAA